MQEKIQRNAEYFVKLIFTSGVNAATQEFPSHTSIDRCPLCGIALNENGVCPKCGYKK